MGNGWSELDRAKSGWVMGGPSLRTDCLGYPWAQASYPVQDSGMYPVTASCIIPGTQYLVLVLLVQVLYSCAVLICATRSSTVPVVQ